MKENLTEFEKWMKKNSVTTKPPNMGTFIMNLKKKKDISTLLIKKKEFKM